jgi:hypothetical protein
MLYFGGIAVILLDNSDTVRRRLERLLPYDRTFVGGVPAAALGVPATAPLIRTYAADGFVLADIRVKTHLAVISPRRIRAAFETFIFALMLRALGVALPARRGPCPQRILQRKPAPDLVPEPPT